MSNKYDISETNWFLAYNQYFIKEDDTPHGSKQLPDISGSKFVRILFDADQVSIYLKMAGWLKFYTYNDVKQNMMVKRETIWLNEYQIIESHHIVIFTQYLNPGRGLNGLPFIFGD
ncbi:hypothetical protein L1F28_33570 [Arthrospira platensis NCB002]|nr:hypothetical protein [Arthrospira platensis NCB002]